MSEQLVYRLLEIGFALWDIGMAREDVVRAVKAKQDSGATPEQVVDFLRDLRNEAAAAARKAVADKLAGK